MGKPQKTVAAEIGIAPETVCRWLKDPEFAAAVEKRAAELRANIQAEVEGAGPKALRYLEGVIDDEGEGTYHRISAARTVLQYHTGLRSNTAAAVEVRPDISEERVESILEALRKRRNGV